VNYLKQHYGNAEGPLGIPCTDRQAQALDKLLQNLPREEIYGPGKAVVAQAPTELLAGERADVSWISTEDADRQHDIILARGMNDEHFKLNPVVTMQHSYWLPPVGRSLWRKRVKDGPRQGIKAKTLYPPRPAAWPAGDWPPDVAFALVQAGLLCGKSIGFLPTKVRQPTDDEIAGNPLLKNVRRIVEEWVLLEYACVYLPAQQNAVVESVSKGLAIPEDFRRAMGLGELPSLATKTTIPFTPWEEIEQAIQRRIEALDFGRIAEQAVQAACDRARGRV
jgi:hypothetical protein